MTTTVPDTAASVVAALREQQTVVDRAEVEKLELAVGWAAMHSTGPSPEPPPSGPNNPSSSPGRGHPGSRSSASPSSLSPSGSPTTPPPDSSATPSSCAEDCPAPTPGSSPGDLRVWRARHIAQVTTVLSIQAAAFVDTHVAPVAHKIGVTAVDRLVEEALVRHDPEAAAENRRAAAEQRRFDIDLQHVGHDGVAYITGCLDTADALDLEHAVQAGAADLAALGSDESLDVRRSEAVGTLARRQPTLGLNSPGETPTVKARQVVIHVDLADQATGRREGGGCISVEQVRDWCGTPDTHVVMKQVIELNQAEAGESWEIPDRFREHVVLRDPTCVFPGCGTRSRGCDLDHIQAWHDGGTTTPSNLAPFCRRHHRLNTHGGWTYTRTRHGHHLWTTRLG